MSTAVTMPGDQEFAGFAAPPTTVSGALNLLATLSRRSAATSEPREFAHEAAQAAAVLLQCSHFGWAEMSADGRQASVCLGSNPRQSRDPDRRKYVLETAGGEGLFLEAMRAQRSVYVPNMSQSSHVDQRLCDCGIASAVVVPLAASQQSIGALGVFDAYPHEFDGNELAILESLASLVSSTISRCAAESDLRRQRSLNQSLHNSMQSIMLVLNPDGQIAAVNAACCALTGFAPGDLEGRSLFSALLLPEEFHQIKRAFTRLARGELTECFDSYLLTRGGQRRRISWSITRLDGEAGSRASIVATGIDITDRCEAVERAVQAEALAEGAKRTLHELKAHVASRERLLDTPPAAQRLPTGVEHDRRARSRAEYSCPQRIAPLHGDGLPPVGAFKELQCRDISSRGFSFLSNVPLACEKVVVAFGAPPNVVHLTADIRHKTEAQIAGRRQYIIGCRYTGRVTKRRANDK